MIPINEPYSDGEYGTSSSCGVPPWAVLWRGSCLVSPNQAGFKAFLGRLPAKRQPGLPGDAQRDCSAPPGERAGAVPLCAWAGPEAWGRWAAGGPCVLCSITCHTLPWVGGTRRRVAEVWRSLSRQWELRLPCPFPCRAGPRLPPHVLG